MDVSKVEHRSYMKIAVLRGINARQCHSELREVLYDSVLEHSPYSPDLSPLHMEFYRFTDSSPYENARLLNWNSTYTSVHHSNMIKHQKMFISRFTHKAVHFISCKTFGLSGDVLICSSSWKRRYFHRPATLAPLSCLHTHVKTDSNATTAFRKCLYMIRICVQNRLLLSGDYSKKISLMIAFQVMLRFINFRETGSVRDKKRIRRRTVLNEAVRNDIGHRLENSLR
ncbi:hypothetical protein ANN_04772 [Periplaneta americana]|uniref:Uncharacterized protein n=1 Tax=Periplaneta americana TaxID=6978 RepID=A0ABQ8TB60_PERAM|nr:hypothetical protein ANN_04772 [Periplaneta americana]